MANYGYIEIPKITTVDFERQLKLAVKKSLGDRWAVELADFEDGGPTWKVTVPGTAPEPDPSVPFFCQEGDVGFPVALQPGQVAFRHCMIGPKDEFARWAQGCVEEELAESLGVPVVFDATGRAVPPGTREYRVGKTFRDYLIQQWDEGYSPEDVRFLEDRFKRYTPEGFW